MAAQIDILDQLKAWIRIGVLPFGAQVLRMEGRCETPLSSWKKTQAFRRLAWGPPRGYSVHHRLTLGRLTLIPRAIPEKIISPALNKRAACLRRCSSR